MSLQNFRAYNMATKLYRSCQTIQAPTYVRDQLLRASLSVALNLGEGSAKTSKKDRCRFYSIALGSLRETQIILDLHGASEARAIANQTGALVYKLVKALEHPQ